MSRWRKPSSKNKITMSEGKEKSSELLEPRVQGESGVGGWVLKSLIFFLINLFIFIFGCVGSSLLRGGFL